MIIPAINAPDFESAKKLILSTKEFLPPNGWIHIDVVDGKFSPASVWGNPADLKKLIAENSWLRKMNFEIHLMVANPDPIIKDWLEVGASRVIVHKEALVDFDFVAALCKEFDAELMLAIRPETSAEALQPFFGKCRQFQVLAVTPGWAGQKFKPEVINKIKYLMEQAPDATIEIDGGINPETARLAKDAGATDFVAASFIFNSQDPRRAFEDLRMATNF